MQNPFEYLENRLQAIENNLFVLLAEIKKLHSPEKEILNVEEASKLLSLSKQTIHNFTSLNKIPYFKKGKRLYFDRAKLLEWLQMERNFFVNKKGGCNG